MARKKPVVGIKNVSVSSGFSYQKYLKKQLEQVVNNVDWRKEYNLKDIALEAGLNLTELDPLALYTRAGGALFDKWELSGSLNEEKIDTISKLQLGKHEKTKDHIKLKQKIHKVIENEDGHVVELTIKDIDRGYYLTPDKQKVKFNKEDVKTRTGFVKKTDIEFVFTQDATFSYAIAGMALKDKLDAEQMLIDTSIEVYEKVIKQYIKDYNGREGDSGYYLYYHNNARSGDPFSHIHFMIPSMIELKDGSVRAVEIPQIKDKDFHASLDRMYKTMLVQKWNERFLDYPVEAYDIDNKTITHESKSGVYDWRIAYDDESLQKIRNRSKSKEMIDEKIAEARKDLENKHNAKLKLLENEAIDYKKLVEANQFTLPHGYLVKHGSDNYQHNKENQMSYYVVVNDRNGNEKTFWGVDLERAIKESNAQTGDLIELNGKAKEKVKVNVPVKDDSGKIIKGKFEEKLVEKAVWKVEKSTKQIISKEIEEDIKIRTERLNKKYEHELGYLESNENRAGVWKAIKQEKKGMAKFLKDVENAKTTESMQLNRKSKDKVGITFKSKHYKEMLETLTNTTPFFTKEGLICELTEAFGNGAEAQEIAKKIIRGLENRKDVVNVGSNTKTQFKYTTTELIKTEQENVSLMRSQFSMLQPKRVNDVDKEISLIEKATGITPNSEQKSFMKSVFNDKQAVVVIGLPGSGKSLAAGWSTKIANKSGYRTIGLAPTGKVTTALANETDCNITATIDKFNIDLANGDVKLTSNDIIFVDETSMVGCRNMHKLLKAVNEAGAKVVLVGDPNQINSVATGNSLYEFLRDKEIKDQVNYLVEIRRQKNEVALEIAETSALKEVYQDEALMRATKETGEHVLKVFDLLDKNEWLKNDFTTTTETIQGVSKDYLEDMNSFKEKLLITSSNKSIDRLNSTIQERRLESNELDGEPIFEFEKRKFFVGDRIIMEKNNKEEYNNGDLGTITAIEGSKITIEYDSGKTKTVENPDKMRLGYAISFEKSQGMTVNAGYVYGEISPNNNQELLNVGMTRARFNTYFYSTKIEHAAVVESFKRGSGRVSLIDLGNQIEAKEKQQQVKANEVIPENKEIKQIKNAIEKIKTDGLGDISEKPKLQKLKKLIADNKLKSKEVVKEQPVIKPIEKTTEDKKQKQKSKNRLKQKMIDR